jgi:hypothetical protein
VLTSLTSFAQEAAVGNDPDIQKIVQMHVDSIKKENKFEDKYKKLTTLIDLTNKEFNNYSNIVTELKSKILELDGNVTTSLIQEKDRNEAIYNSWATFKVALEPNYELFVEKSDKYHCNAVSQEIWQNYSPTDVVEKKVELDPYIRKAVENSVVIAEDICNSLADKESAKSK